MKYARQIKNCIFVLARGRPSSYFIPFASGFTELVPVIPGDYEVVHS